MIRTLKWLIGIDLILLLVSGLLGRMDWLLNTQIGFISSALVLGASMFSYSQMVYSRLESGTAVPDDDRDEIDKMEDPYDLYGEDTPVDETQQLKEAIREEKQRMKQNRRSAYQTLKDSRASLSILRLGAYLLLFVGFFYLSKNQLLHIPSYLIAMALPIVIIVGLLLTKKEEIDEAGV
jgi:hypothetical protein